MGYLVKGNDNRYWRGWWTLIPFMILADGNEIGANLYVWNIGCIKGNDNVIRRNFRWCKYFWTRYR